MYTLTPDPHTFSIAAFSQIRLPYNAQLAVFAAFFLAFAIKIPLFPFHSWQAETYNASPVQGSMLLAGIMLKMGLYGIIRFLIPFCPDVLTATSGIYMPFILFGVIYGAFIAISEPMMKRLIAFASLSHVGLISLGLFAGNVWAFEGAVLQMFSHGVNVVGMFLCYQIIVKRTNTDRIAELGGIASVAPRFTIAFFIIVLANIGLPLTNSFVGEYLILLGLFQSHPIMAVVAGTSIIFGAVYMLKLFQKLMYGQKNSITSSFSDLTTIEILMLLPIILLIFVIGIYPTPVLQMLEEVYRSLK